MNELENILKQKEIELRIKIPKRENKNITQHPIKQISQKRT